MPDLYLETMCTLLAEHLKRSIGNASSGSSGFDVVATPLKYATCLGLRVGVLIGRIIAPFSPDLPPFSTK